MDTTDGIPWLSDNDPLSLVGSYSRDLRDYLDGSAYPFVPINGWTAVEPVTVVKVGPVAFFTGEVTGADAGSTFPIGFLPTGLRPTSRIRFYIPRTSSTYTYVAIDPDGRVWAADPQTSSPGWMLGSINYVIGG